MKNLPKFQKPTIAGFSETLKKRVYSFFEKQNISSKGDHRLYSKAIILLVLFGLLYTFWVRSDSLVEAVLIASVLGIVCAMIGFNIMHDAVHGSFSQKQWINKLFGLTLNMVNGYDGWWERKHNIFHHTYTNINGADEDIAVPLMRMHPEQSWKPIHRYQKFYWPFMYSLTYIAWTLINDFKRIGGKIGTHSFRIKKGELVRFAISKTISITFFIGIPLFFLGIKTFLISFLVLGVITGIFIAVIFQLAHIVEDTEKPIIQDFKSEDEWLVHQVKTTANFACQNRFLNWICGGLNFQIEHHLFREISHVHYPAIASIVKETCKEFGIRYTEYKTFREGFVSHLKTITLLSIAPTKG